MDENRPEKTVVPDKTAADQTEHDLDDNLADTFPASDPLPVSGTIAPTHPKEGEDSENPDDR